MIKTNDTQNVTKHLAGDTWQEALHAYTARLRMQFGPAQRLLLVQAPQFLFETINPEVIRNRGYYAYPPTGLQRLAASLSERDIEVEILDLNLHVLKGIAQGGQFDSREWLRVLDDYLDAFRPTIVGATCLTVYTDLFATYHPLTGMLRHLSNRGDHLVVIGGPTATTEMDRYVQEGLCHFGVQGEGEDRLNYLLDLYEERSEPAEAISGISFPWEGRTLRTQGKCGNVTLRGNLVDTYAAVDVEEYCQVGSLNPYSRMAGQDTVYGVCQLNRGCRGNCKFCGVRSFMGKGVRTHPVDEVIEEVSYLVRQRSVRHFELLDDDFLADREVAAVFLTALGRLHREYGITWAANNGLMTNSITRDLLDLMRDSGCLGFKIGIESGNPDMLRRVRKPGTLESFVRVADMLDDHPELFVGGNYIIGLFGEETFGQMIDTFAFSVRLNLDWSSFTVFQFTSKPNCEAENLKTNGDWATDFIPGKDNSDREIEDDRTLPLGAEVFSLPADLVPSRALVKNIWLTFNVLGNCVGNKNLKPGGRPEQFVVWVDAVRVAYPSNPYMLLFAGLGRILMGESNRARAMFRSAQAIVDDSSNWQYRFAKFGLDELLKSVPTGPSEVYQRLETLWKGCVPKSLRTLVASSSPVLEVGRGGQRSSVRRAPQREHPKHEQYLPVR